MAVEQAEAPRKLPAPRHLGARGRRVWRELTSVFDLEDHELVVLEEACRVADAIAALADQIAHDGYMSVGSQGQPVVHPAVGELRQQQLALARLVTTLNLPSEDGTALVRETSAKAKAAAQARWRDQAKRVARG